VNKRLREGSLVVFDKGANSIDNIGLIKTDKMQYLTARKLNTSDDKIITKFRTYPVEIIDPKDGVYGLKIIKPSNINHLYFSKKLQKEQLESRARKIMRQIEEAKLIQNSIDKNKKLPKKFRINNALVDIV